MGRPPLDSHPWLREIQIGRLVGWPLLTVTLVSGTACGLVGLALSEPAPLVRSEELLLIPAAIPVAFALASGRSLLLGAIGGLFSAAIAFLVVAAYGLWQVACFIITFMGEC